MQGRESAMHSTAACHRAKGRRAQNPSTGPRPTSSAPRRRLPARDRRPTAVHPASAGRATAREGWAVGSWRKPRRGHTEMERRSCWEVQRICPANDAGLESAFCSYQFASFRRIARSSQCNASANELERGAIFRLSALAYPVLPLLGLGRPADPTATPPLRHERRLP